MYTDNIFYDNQEILMNYDKLKKNNKTKPLLSKYEKTSIVGLRAQQIAYGAKPSITVPKHITNTIDIAELEFKEKKIPLFIKRYINQTSYEFWRQEDMISM
jgi:DNA-directed RNA polymerase subunit K/omega